MTTAFRITRPDTAFATERTGKQRRPRIEQRDHLAFIRTLSCCICGTHAHVEAAHIRARSTQFKKRQAGMSEKSDDKWTVPMCAEHHRLNEDAQHNSNELKWWLGQKVDPFILALALFGCQGDQEEAEYILAEARPTSLSGL